MNPKIVLWVYIVLLMAGGMIGFLKAKSKMSLITSSIFAALLVLCATPGILDPRMSRILANVILAVLLVFFASRFTKSRKFMPGGMMMAITLIALVCLNLLK
ncbi:MAG TPA: TMEM14 family protein [Verrucomicrobiae bacterium]|jgi:uncharacterized membrane protein (UPF0136 family)